MERSSTKCVLTKCVLECVRRPTSRFHISVVELSSRSSIQPSFCVVVRQFNQVFVMRRCAIKTFIAVLALILLIAIPSFTQTANAAPRRQSSGGNCEVPSHGSAGCTVKEGESDDKMCLLRSAAGEAGQRERGRGFPAFRRTVGQRRTGH